MSSVFWFLLGMAQIRICRGGLEERIGGLHSKALSSYHQLVRKLPTMRLLRAQGGICHILGGRCRMPFNDIIMPCFVNISFQTASGVTGNTVWTDLHRDIRYWQSLFYQACFSQAVLKECWHGAVSSLSTPHSVHSFKASSEAVPRKLQSHTRAAETGDSGDPRALRLGFLSAQQPPSASWWIGQVSPLTILLKGRDP